jgi:hypothetical protein
MKAASESSPVRLGLRGMSWVLAGLIRPEFLIGVMMDVYLSDGEKEKGAAIGCASGNLSSYIYRLAHFTG